MRAGLVAVLSGLLFWGSAANTQSTLSSGASMPAPDQLFTSDLISWTQTQFPEPLASSAQTIREKDSSAPKTSTSRDEQTDSPLQTFTGMIQKEGNSYVLRISDKWFYDLDDQSEAEQYLNQHVAVIGRLNLSGDLIHVRLIQPVS
jgi:hypothetical protein